MPETQPPPPVRPRRRRKRRYVPSYPLKIALAVMAGCLSAWVLFMVLAKVARPYQLGYQEEAKAAVLRGHRDHQRQTNTALRKRIAYLRSPEGQESEARRAGYHRPGEMVYLLDPATLNDPVPVKPRP